MKFPSFAHWKQFFKILSRKERAAFITCVFLALISATILIAVFYQKHTTVVAADNGVYVEGMVGKPRFLNPVYAASYSVDQDITQLLFAGLLEYDLNGQIIPGMADYKISEDGKTYEFTLKDGVQWSDGKLITSDDAIYTIKIIQDPAYKSPLRPQWIGVETEKISDNSFRLKLQAPYAAFLENCTLKIIPRHIWEKTDSDEFSLSPFNLNPVGSGHYKAKKINLNKDNAIESIELERSPYFYGIKPFLRQITFIFFKDADTMATAFKQGRVQGYAVRENGNNKNIPSGAITYDYLIPRYFAVFFNSEKNNTLSDVAVRTALARAIDKNEILQVALKGRGKIVDSPIFYDIYNINAPETIMDYDPQEAARILDDAGYKQEDGEARIKTANRQPAFQFTKNLVKGTSLTVEVQELQKCLSREVMPDLEATGNFGNQTLEAVNLFQEKYRQDILDPQNIKKPTGDVKIGTREKLNEVCFPAANIAAKLEITITAADQEPFPTVAEIIKNQWENIGVTVNVNMISIADIERDIVKPRAYEALLFGQALGAIPDPYPFWHSSQKIDPGLNFALYENKEADQLLEEIRSLPDQAARAEKLQSLQNMIIKDVPAIFLYNPDYVYIVSKNVKNVRSGIITDPGRRFINVADWSTTTKRIFNFGS